MVAHGGEGGAKIYTWKSFGEVMTEEEAYITGLVYARAAEVAEELSRKHETPEESPF